MMEFSISGAGLSAYFFRPWSEQEQSPVATEVKIGTFGLESFLKALILHNYHLTAIITGILHNGSLGRMNGRCDGYSTFVYFCLAIFRICQEFRFAPMAMDSDRK